MNWMKKVGLLALVLLFLTACGVTEELPTEGLTGAIGVSQQSSDVDTSPETSGLLQFEIQLTGCEGQWDPERNMLQLSLEAAPGQQMIGDSNLRELKLIGGSAAFYDAASPNLTGMVQMRCVGADPVMTVVRLQGLDQSENWMAAMSAPQMRVQLPNGNTRRLENVAVGGVLAPKVTDVPAVFEAVYGVEAAGWYEAFWAGQRVLYQNHPDAAYIREWALKSGISAENANRFGQLYVEPEEAKQRQLLLNIITSESDQYVEYVVGTTVRTMLAVGATEAEVSQIFAEQTNGRITVQFVEKVDGGAYPGAKVANRTGTDEVEVLFASQTNDGSGGSVAPPPPEGQEGGDGGTGSGSDGGTGSGSDGGTGSGDDGGTGSGNDGGTGSGNDGGTGSGNDGGDGKGGDNPNDGDDKPGVWEFLNDLFWNVIESAGMVGGAFALFGSFFGPEGTVVGGLIGVGVGGAAGIVDTFTEGVYDPNPNSQGGPCSSPIVHC